MTLTAADLLVEKLANWGVEYVFGLPGDGINGLMEALRKVSDEISFIQVRHEEAAAFMATGYAKTTGKLGVCLATSGPGGLHLLNGLYDAKLDGQPVLAITGLPFHDLIGTHTQQDVQLDRVFADVAGYNARIMGSAHVENVVDLACRTAMYEKCVAHITFPVDMQSAPATRKGSERNVPFHTSSVTVEPGRVASEKALDRAAEILNESSKVAILAGRGALNATDQLEAVAERLGAPIAKALLGKAAVPDDSPYTTGSIGQLGTAPTHHAMETCNALLIVGSSFPYIEHLPTPGEARAIQIDLQPSRIGLRYPVELGLVGDAAATLDALLPRLRKRDEHDFLKSVQEHMTIWRDLMEQRGQVKDTPMKPQVVAWNLGQRLTDDAIFIADSGTAATWWARQVPARRGQIHTVSGNLASMANGVCYAAAAQLAHPNRQCVALVGDGAFSMLMAEFATCVKYDLPVTIVVLRNDSLGQIMWEQLVNLGNPEYGCELQPIDFVKFASACGGTGFRIDDPRECGDILDAALAHDGPVLVEAVVDSHEPPMPPKVSLHDAAQLAKSLARGTPDRDEIIKTIFTNQIRERI